MTTLAPRLPLPLLFGAVVNADLRAVLVERLLSLLDHGRLTVHLPDGQRISHKATRPGPEADITLHNWRALRRLLTGGDTGFADSYIAGDWDTSDLTAFLALWAHNASALDSLAGMGTARLLRRLGHRLRPNSKAGSRRNIMAHYDLGNAFYREWLDPGMIYSAGIYTAPGQSLEEAQASKLARIAQLLTLNGSERVLEIGCGWGGLAAHLAGHGAAHVTGLTISPAQLAHAREMLEDAALTGTVDLRLQDYRDTRETFDRIVSIEMFEAVGEAYWPVYFDTLRRSLTPEGHAVLQVITIAEERFEGYRRTPDFIQTSVFPGGMLPSKTALAEVAKERGLALVSAECFGESYARTLADWRERFLAAWPTISAMGYSERFKRLWLYYLSYCEAGFRTGLIDVGLYVLKPV